MTGDLQTIATGDPSRRMQEIDMSCAIGFRMEGTLDGKRTNMAPTHQPRFAILMLQPKLKLCTPAIRLQGALLACAIVT